MGKDSIHTEPPEQSPWLLWQLIDSSFPSGGFAHSGGLEAARQWGSIRDASSLNQFLIEILWQSGHGGLPLINAACDQPERLREWDSLCDAFLINHVANRASRAQGRAFLSTCEKSFLISGIDLENRGALSSFKGPKGIKWHFAPAFGYLLTNMGVPKQDVQRAFLFSALRGPLSAAVRIAAIGPHEAQSIQARLGGVLDQVLERCSGLKPEDLSQTAPILDLVHSTHDRLYSRLFLS